jgi:hypothetical protein
VFAKDVEKRLDFYVLQTDDPPQWLVATDYFQQSL